MPVVVARSRMPAAGGRARRGSFLIAISVALIAGCGPEPSAREVAEREMIATVKGLAIGDANVEIRSLVAGEGDSDNIYYSAAFTLRTPPGGSRWVVEPYGATLETGVPYHGKVELLLQRDGARWKATGHEVPEFAGVVLRQ